MAHEHGLVFVVLPHPSGLSRAWNEAGAYERARALLREVSPEIRWGETSGRIRGSGVLSDYEQGRLDYEQGRGRGFGWAHLTDPRRTEHDRGFCDARRGDQGARPCTNCGRAKAENVCPDCGEDQGETGATR